MSHLTDDFEIDLPLAEANTCCLHAISTLDWKIASLEPQKITIKAGMGLTSWPSRVEILLRRSDDPRTRVFLVGNIGGFGPIQKGHLNRRMTELREAILTRAQRSDSSA